MATRTQTPEPLEPFDGTQGRSAGRNVNGFSVLNLLVIVAGRIRMVLAVALACLAISLIAAFLLPDEYTSTVLLLPPQQNSSIATMLESQLGSLGPLAALGGSSLGLKKPNDMYVAMLKSQVVEDAMVKRFGLMKEYHKGYLSKARKAFEKHVDVDGSGKDGLIHISVEDRNPQKAAQMANSYVQQFRELSQSLAASGAGQRADFFQQQLKQAQDKLSNAENALKQTEQTTGLIDLSSQARALIESAASLRAEIAEKKVQIQALRTFAASGNSQMQQAQQELASLQGQLAELGGSQQSPSSLIVPKGNVPEAGLEYARKLRDVKYYETIFELLARQYELAKLDQAKKGALVQVISPASVPDRRSFPPRGLIVVAGALAGLFLGMTIAVCQEGWMRLREDPESNAKLGMIHEGLRGLRRRAGPADTRSPGRGEGRFTGTRDDE